MLYLHYRVSVIIWLSELHDSAIGLCVDMYCDIIMILIISLSLYIGIAAPAIIVSVVLLIAAIIFGLCIYYHKCRRKCGNDGCQGILYFLIVVLTMHICSISYIMLHAWFMI